MKKFFTLAALFALLAFVGCSKDDDGIGVSGGTPYSGDLLGTWDFVYDANEIGALTFYRDGSFMDYWEYTEDGDWIKEYGLFYVSEENKNIFVLQYMTSKASWGETYNYLKDDGEYYYEYYYVYDVASDYIEMITFGRYYSLELDWDYVYERYENGNLLGNEKTIYYKR